MASQTFGPIGLIYRGNVRRAALAHGVQLQEERSLVDSMFRATGPSDAIFGFSRYLKGLVRSVEAADHDSYVAAMERSEKRRAWWGSLVGRNVRTQPLSRQESAEVYDLLYETMWDSQMVCPDASSRLSKSVSSLGRLLDDKGICDDVVGTMAAVRMRYLQNDIRNGGIRVSKDLRRRTLGAGMPMDTWKD